MASTGEHHDLRGLIDDDHAIYLWSKALIIPFDVAAGQVNQQVFRMHANTRASGSNRDVQRWTVRLENAVPAGEAFSITLDDGTTTSTINIAAAGIEGIAVVPGVRWLPTDILQAYYTSGATQTGRCSIGILFTRTIP